MVRLVLSIALSAIAAPGAAQDRRVAEIWNGTTGTLYVTDNGATVCETPSNNMCTWTLTDGFHRVEITAPNGYRNITERTIPNDEAPFSAFSDCDFTSAGCPPDEFDSLLGEP